MTKMATDRRAQRLLSDLNNCFRRDPEIDEFDFIPVPEPQHNRSPVVLVDHKLGLEQWSIKILYPFVYDKLISWRTKKSHKFIDTQELVNLTQAGVLINAENYTFWNIRKELIESGELSIQDDLKLSTLVLTKHPKSSETFCHRRWVLGRFIDNHLQSSSGSTGSTGSHQDGFISVDSIDVDLSNNLQQNGLSPGVLNIGQMSEVHTQLKQELKVCTCAADRYPSNYYAWSYRIWLLQHAYNCSTQILLSELHTTERWASLHISDYCGFHYRQFVLSSLGRQRDQLLDQFRIDYVTLLQREQMFIQDLVVTYPGHEALWNHRRSVFRMLHSVLQLDPVIPTEDNLQKKTRLELDQQVLEQKEVDSVSKKELLSKDVQQKRLAQHYLNWIQKVVFR